MITNHESILATLLLILDGLFDYQRFQILCLVLGLSIYYGLIGIFSALYCLFHIIIFISSLSQNFANFIQIATIVPVPKNFNFQPIK